MKNNKAVFAIIESLFLLLLIIVGFSYFYNTSQNTVNSDYTYTLTSILNTMNKNDDYMDIVLKENLSQSTITQNWSQITNYLDSQFNNYLLYVGNTTTQKTIVSCNSRFETNINQLMVIGNKISNEVGFKVLTLGVCI